MELLILGVNFVVSVDQEVAAAPHDNNEHMHPEDRRHDGLPAAEAMPSVV